MDKYEIFGQGYDACRGGIEQERCPYFDREKQEIWSDGWKEAFVESYDDIEEEIE